MDRTLLQDIRNAHGRPQADKAMPRPQPPQTDKGKRPPPPPPLPASKKNQKLKLPTMSTMVFMTFVNFHMLLSDKNVYND